MPAHIKMLRLLGAVLVTLALVPWLGVSPASATGGGGGGSSSSTKSHQGDRDKSDDKSQGKSQGKSEDRSQGKSDDKSQGKLEDTSADKSQVDPADKSVGKSQGKSDDKSQGKAEDKSDDKAPAKSDDKAPAQSDDKAPAQSDGSSNQKVTLCHRTNSGTNPYVRITVSVNSVVKASGHDGHNGPVFHAGMKAAKQKWGDIIPSFSYTTKSGSTATYGGKNWPAGQAIYNAGCVVSQPTTTTSPSPTTSVSPSDTTSVSPSGTATVTTTVTGPNATVTVTQTVTSDTSVQPTKIGNDDEDDTDVLGTKNGGVLARTGLDLPLGAVLGLSFLLLLAGGSLMVVPSRMATERSRRH